jgi:predicted ATPase
MELIERDGFLALLQTHFKNIEEGEGHCVFVSGEAGIGKSSLIKSFCKQQKGNCNIYLGACDALFTPRPLAPLYDVMLQINSDLSPDYPYCFFHLPVVPIHSQLVHSICEEVHIQRNLVPALQHP